MVTYHPNATDPENLGEPLTVDFTPPFRRVRMIPDLEKVLNVKLPPPSEFGTPGNESVFSFFTLFSLGEGDTLWLLSYSAFVKQTTLINKPGSNWDTQGCNFSFLKNSLVQINSKMNFKPYDYLY